MLRHETKTDLTDEMLLNVYVLEAPGKEIRDLTGLEKCKNLALLKLSKNKVADLKPLKDLGNIQSLELDDNAIVDLAPWRALRSSSTSSSRTIRLPTSSRSKS